MPADEKNPGSEKIEDMLKSIITTTLIFTCATLCGQDIKTFKKDNISFECPANWVTRDVEGYYILVTEPPKEQLSVMTTFDVTKEEAFKSLKEYCKGYEDKMTTNDVFKEFKVESKKEIDFKGMKAIAYHCTATAQYIPVEWKSIVFIKDGMVYKLSITSIIGQFTLQEEIIDKIFNSFEIK